MVIMNLTDISKRRCNYMASSKDKDTDTKITYSLPDETFSGGWAPAADSYTVSYSDPEGTQMDFNEMLRQDAGKGMENMKFEDWNDPKPFENTVQ